MKEEKAELRFCVVKKKLLWNHILFAYIRIFCGDISVRAIKRMEHEER